MKREIGPTFSELVCSASPVRAAFSGPSVLRLWWLVILTLHGKPRDPQLTDAARTECIANGFQFYAHLYRLLAVIFLSLSLLLGVLRISLSENGTWYWCVASLLAAIYLWLVSGLGYVGSAAYRRGEGSSISSLVAFMVMIIAFLSLFLSAASIAAYHFHWLTMGPNLAIAVGVFTLGIGSYFIEVLYLATEGNLSVSRRGV